MNMFQGVVHFILFYLTEFIVLPFLLLILQSLICYNYLSHMTVYTLVEISFKNNEGITVEHFDRTRM